MLAVLYNLLLECDTFVHQMNSHEYCQFYVIFIIIIHGKATKFLNSVVHKCDKVICVSYVLTSSTSWDLLYQLGPLLVGTSYPSWTYTSWDLLYQLGPPLLISGRNQLSLIIHVLVMLDTKFTNLSSTHHVCGGSVHVQQLSWEYVRYNDHTHFSQATLLSPLFHLAFFTCIFPSCTRLISLQPLVHTITHCVPLSDYGPVVCRDIRDYVNYY